MQYGRVPYDIGSRIAPGVTPKDIAASLSKLNRYTGHTIYPLSVARHSVYVSKLLEINTWAAMYGLVHDVHETVVNDLSHPVKRALSRAARAEYDAIADAADEALYAVLKVPYPMPPDIAALVKKADWVAAANERQSLLRDCPREWAMLQEPATHIWADETDCPKEDEGMWMERYTELCDHLGIDLAAA